jgi:hypothetical protein
VGPKSRSGRDGERKIPTPAGNRTPVVPTSSLVTLVIEQVAELKSGGPEAGSSPVKYFGMSDFNRRAKWI